MGYESPTTVDSFMYFNEGAVCIYRLLSLAKVVDRFIVIEGTHTFLGQERELRFLDTIIPKLQGEGELLDKIEYRPVDMSSCLRATSPWEREQYLRDAVTRFITDDESAVIVADCDEIPSVPWILGLREILGGEVDNSGCRVSSAQMLLFYGSLRNLMFDESHAPLRWKGPYAIKARELRQLSPHAIRQAVMRDERVVLSDGSSCEPSEFEEGGWHLSYFGHEEMVDEKMNSFSHQEDAVQFFRSDLQASLKAGVDPFRRSLYLRPPTGGSRGQLLPHAS